MIRPSIAAVAILLALFLTASAQEFRWENYTNKDEITSLESFGGYVWATTTGGVVRFTPGADEIRSFINSDGLGSIKINFATYGGNDEAYFGSADGILSKLDLATMNFTSTELRSRDGSSLPLNAADTSGDFLWIACNVGLIKYDRVRNGGEVKETYRNLGVFQSESAVNDVIVFAGKIFAGTDEGIVFADVDNEFLLDPAEWTSIELGNPGLADIKVNCLGIQDGSLFVGTNQRLFAFDGGTALTPVEGFAAMEILDLKQVDSPTGKLFALVSAEGGHQLFQVSPFEWIQLQFPAGVPSTSVTSIARNAGWYVGSEGYGVCLAATGTTLIRLIVPGPTSNNLMGGGYGADGRLYVVARDNDLAILQDGDWERQTVSANEKLAALVDKAGDLWIATFGDGAYRVLNNGALQHYSQDNSPLIGIAQDPDVVVVNSVSEDPAGRIWFSLFQANPLRPIVVFDPGDSVWTFFDGADGFVSGNNQVVAAGTGTAALGVDDLGVAFLRYGDGPFNHSDDQLAYFSRSRRLPSEIVTAMAYDHDNVLWVGTTQGLTSFDEGVEFFFPEELPAGLGANVTAIAVDPRNNLWIGTSAGLGYIGNGVADPLLFTTSNSDLVSDEIESLVYDNDAKKLLVFTRGGLSILDYSPVGPENGDKVYAYPNPFRIGAASENLLQFLIDQRGTVRILSIAGDLVSETTVNDGWDGRNSAGEFVASGVYIWSLKAEDGSQHSGKIFVIRR